MPVEFPPPSADHPNDDDKKLSIGKGAMGCLAVMMAGTAITVGVALDWNRPLGVRRTIMNVVENRQREIEARRKLSAAFETQPVYEEAFDKYFLLMLPIDEPETDPFTLLAAAKADVLPEFLKEVANKVAATGEGYTRDDIDTVTFKLTEKYLKDRRAAKAAQAPQK